jgi:hypothetical protein
MEHFSNSRNFLAKYIAVKCRKELPSSKVPLLLPRPLQNLLPIVTVSDHQVTQERKMMRAQSLRTELEDGERIRNSDGDMGTEKLGRK